MFGGMHCVEVDIMHAAGQRKGRVPVNYTKAVTQIRNCGGLAEETATRSSPATALFVAVTYPCGAWPSAGSNVT